MDIGAFIAAAVVGLVVGVLSGLLGIGGGTMMVPVFRLGFGLDTSPVGVWLASMSPAWLIMLAAALIIGYSAFNMLRKAFKKPKAAPAQAAAARTGANVPEASAADANGTPADMAPVAAHAESSAFSVERKHLFMGVAIGLTAGLASGYVGVGGGFIMVPMFLSLLSLPMKKTSGTSLIAVTILAIPGVIEQAMLGHIDFIAGIAMAVGSIPGAVLGAQLMKRVPERALRIFFGVFLLIMAVVLVVNEFAAA